MKKHFFLIIFIVISLALPFLTIAQTQLKMRLMTETGDMITTTEPRIKNFFLSSGDGTLSIILQDPLNFTFTDSDTRIGITNPGAGSTIPGDGSVTVNAGGTVEFDVYSTTPGNAISRIIIPGGDFVEGTTKYRWITTAEDIGTYLAVFQASAQGKNTSQIVVMIKVVPPGYSLTVNIQGNGTVTKNPDKQAYNLNPVETVQLTATPGNGYYFSGWSGDLSGSTNPAPIIMNGNKTVTATFAQIPTYTLQVNSSDSGVPITVSQADNNGQQSGNAPFTRTYNQNTVVTLTAPSTYNSKNFSGWNGADSVTGTQATVTMTGNKTVTVNYASSTPTGTPLPWNTRTNLNLSKGSEQVYIANVGTSDKIYLSVSIIGITNETDATYTWTFPDGTVFNGAVLNTSINGILLLRTRTYGYANIPYDYIPAGNHVLRIRANKNSSFVIRTSIY